MQIQRDWFAPEARNGRIMKTVLAMRLALEIYIYTLHQKTLQRVGTDKVKFVSIECEGKLL